MSDADSVCLDARVVVDVEQGDTAAVRDSAGGDVKDERRGRHHVGGFDPLATRGGGDVVGLSPGLAEILRTCELRRGIACVFVEGSTAAITTMEHEPGGVEDLRTALERLLPAGAGYAHDRLNDDDNEHAHLRASFIGPSETVPLVDGALVLGNWQQVVLVDFDTRPRQARVQVPDVG